MKLYHLPFLVLPLALTACANTMTGDSTKNYGEMSEESLTATNYEDNSYLMAATPEYHIGQSFKIDDVQYFPMEDVSSNSVSSIFRN
jgi:hypothetical protein